MNLKKTFLAAGLAAVAFAAQQAAGALEVGVTDWSIDGDTGEDVATIAYNITEPCVVTMDIITNTTGGVWHSGDKYVSIGGENIVPGVSADSDVWKKVSSSPGMIKWRPGRAWKDNKTLADAMRVVVTAWPLTNPPPYMVVDITEGAATNASRSVCDNIRYYQSEDFVPGGVLGNVRYRQSAILLRKVVANGITWTMGSARDDERPSGLKEWTGVQYSDESGKYGMVANEAPHSVTLTNDYYMSVFPITQAQWAIMRTKNQYPSWFTNRTARIMCPVEQVSYAQIRTANIVDAENNTWSADYEFPRDPNEKSYLGLLRKRTGVRFDLPGEAQWEWACRAGHGYGYWGDGSTNTYVDTTASALLPEQLAAGRTYPRNKDAGGAGTDAGRDFGAESGTAVCGSYKANSWGIYDMCGNVREICLDWTDSSVSAVTGNLSDWNWVNIDPENRGNMKNGSAGAKKVRRGGYWSYWPLYCRPAVRQGESSTTKWKGDGFRVMCPAEVP